MRLLEHYVSTQGEGPKVGTPTQFVRFAGCNLRCPGWPCDTEFAIDPKQWRTEAQSVGTDHLIKQIAYQSERGVYNVCLTGGEPLLQDNDDLRRIAYVVVNQLQGACEVFTNGSRPIPPSLANWATFVMDWKLPGSGEKFNEAYESTRRDNIKSMRTWSRYASTNSVKFVCKNIADVEEAKRVYAELNLAHSGLEVYFGNVWSGGMSIGNMVEYLIENPPRTAEGRPGPWKLNVQVHNYLWPANERRR